LEGTIRKLNVRGVACEPVSTQGWGRSTRLRLPGGGGLRLYEPRHARP
ncbi:MAG: extradiol dioxygenase, partial [Proteobacteria bacterium]|nr:extradiol dioxygenase [Pseudomonadota bacterium]